MIAHIAGRSDSWYNAVMNVLLIGARAAGKTTIGKLLAQQLRWPFIDLDDRVRARFTEPTVHDIWRMHGEPAWRAAEAQELEVLLNGTRQVIALGGGAPMIPAAAQLIQRERLADRVGVVFLSCEIAELQRRLKASAGDRPALTSAGAVVDEVPVVLAQRLPTYRALADAEVNTANQAPSETASMLRKLPWMKTL